MDRPTLESLCNLDRLMGGLLRISKAVAMCLWLILAAVSPTAGQAACAPGAQIDSLLLRLDPFELIDINSMTVRIAGRDIPMTRDPMNRVEWRSGASPARAAVVPSQGRLDVTYRALPGFGVRDPGTVPDTFELSRDGTCRASARREVVREWVLGLGSNPPLLDTEITITEGGSVTVEPLSSGGSRTNISEWAEVDVCVTYVRIGYLLPSVRHTFTGDETSESEILRLLTCEDERAGPVRRAFRRFITTRDPPTLTIRRRAER